MNYSKEKLARRIERVKQRIETLKKQHGETPSLTYTYHAGWDLGYWMGMLTILEDVFDELYPED